MIKARIHITSYAPRSGTALLAELRGHGFRFDAWGEREFSIFNRAEGSPTRF